MLEQTPKADRFIAQVVAHQALPRRRRVAFVEHQVDHPQHAIKTLRQFGQRRHLIGNSRIADLGFGADDALGDGRRALQKRAGDFFGGQVTDFAQGQRHLGIGGQRRVTAGEDQAQAVVLQLFVIHLSLLERLQRLHQLRLGTVETRTPAQAVDRLEAPGGHQPGPGAGRNTVTLPAFDGNEKCFVHGLFSQVEVAQQANQCRQDAPRLLAIDRLQLCPYRSKRGHQSGICVVTSATRRSRLSPQPR
ncbi:hypothetical protein D3C80_1025860 [compost metagenome]